MRPWYRFCQQSLQVLFCSFLRMRAWNRENVPLSGPVLLVSNHQSFLDPVLCGVGLQRELDYIARDSLFHNPAFARLIRSLNAFPIQRGHADLAAIRSVIDRLRAGRAVVLFPEGTRTADGRITPIKGGFELIARKAKATTVPVVVDGAFEAWPRTQLLPGFGHINVMYGKPVSPEEARTLSRDEFAARVTQSLRDMQRELRCRADRKPFD